MNTQKQTRSTRHPWLLAAVVGVALCTALGCQPPPKPGSAPAAGAPSANLGASASIKDLMAARGPHRRPGVAPHGGIIVTAQVPIGKKPLDSRFPEGF